MADKEMADKEMADKKMADKKMADKKIAKKEKWLKRLIMNWVKLEIDRTVKNLISMGFFCQ